jgi:hypothetical protein
VNTPSNPYLESLLALKRAPQYLASGVLPRRNKSKEVTESMAAFYAVRDALGPARFGDDAVSLLDVGCGHAPRTAALFALTTAWTCEGVDPVLKRQAKGVSNCFGLSLTLEQWCSDQDDVIVNGTSPLVVVAVHSHASLAPLEAQIGRRELLVVALPCCVPQMLRRPDGALYQCTRTYQDQHVLSEQRTVKVWHFPVP